MRRVYGRSRAKDGSDSRVFTLEPRTGRTNPVQFGNLIKRKNKFMVCTDPMTSQTDRRILYNNTSLVWSSSVRQYQHSSSLLNPHLHRSGTCENTPLGKKKSRKFQGASLYVAGITDTPPSFKKHRADLVRRLAPTWRWYIASLIKVRDLDILVSNYI